MDKLAFQSKEYEYRRINTKYGYFLVSSCDLEDELINDLNEYISREAKMVDEMIYFYVPRSVLEADETFLTEYVDRNVLY